MSLISLFRMTDMIGRLHIKIILTFLFRMQQVPKMSSCRGIHSGRWFIQQDYFRAPTQGGSHTESSLHASGETVGYYITLDRNKYSLISSCCNITILCWDLVINFNEPNRNGFATVLSSIDK